MSSRRQLLALAVLVCASLAYVWKYVRGATEISPSFDIYAYAYPMMIQAVAAVRDGGRGLLWNALQNCGQPFFGSGTTGLLYPGNLFFFVTDYDHALYALLAFNFVVASVSAYCLCRELGMGPLAACCGGLSFGLGASSVDVNTSTPIISGPYVWFPAAILFCERILRRPSLGNTVGLALCTAITLIPGHPQFVLYLLQIIAARFLWELATDRRQISARTVGALIGGLALAPLLVAVQLFPVVELTRESIRGRTLTMRELTNGPGMTWGELRTQLAWRWDHLQPFLVLPYMLAAAAAMYRPGRRILLFYALVGLLALDLGLGGNGFFFPLYVHLPFVALFRFPNRILVITAFCAAILAAGGVEAAVGRASRPGWRSVVAVGGLLLLGMIGMNWLVPNGMNPYETWLAAIVLAAGSLAVAHRRLQAPMGAAIVVALLLQLIYFRGPAVRNLLPDGGILFAHRALFTALQARVTAQDRVYLAPPHRDHSFQQKTAALFGIPAVFDYNSQASQRFADYFSVLRTGHPIRNFNDWAYALSGFVPPTLNRRLLNLAAGRYVVVPATTAPDTPALHGMSLNPEISDGEVHVYDNPEALPRAFWVGAVEVVAQPAALLARLATDRDDLQQVALLESAPASGFLGGAVPASAATVAFTRNDPERVTLRVSAPGRGFVLLADQHFPGWRATVNDVPVPIERANYVFRLVEVPAGESVVEFRYAPRSLMLGALVSALAWLVAIGLLVVSYRRRSPTAAAGGATGVPRP